MIKKIIPYFEGFFKRMGNFLQNPGERITKTDAYENTGLASRRFLSFGYVLYTNAPQIKRRESPRRACW